MKIAVISKYGLGPASGHNNRIHKICQSFLEINGELDITLITSISCGYKYDLSNYDSRLYYYVSVDNNICHILLKGPKINLGLNFTRIVSWVVFEIFLFSFLFNKKFNVLWVSSLSLLSILNGIFSKFRYKSRLVFEIRDIWPQSIIEIAGSRNIFTIILRQIELYGYKKSDLIVSPLNDLSSYLGKINPKLKKKFHYIAQNIEDKCDYPPAIIKSDKLGICYAGSFGKANAVEDFISALSVQVLDPRVIFYFIGKGEDFYRLKSIYSNQQFIFKDYMDPVNLGLFLHLNCNIGVQFIPDRSIYQYGISPNKWSTYHNSGLAICTFSFIENNLLKSYDAGMNFEFTDEGVKEFTGVINKADLSVVKYHDNFRELSREKFSLKNDLIKLYKFL